MHWGSVRNPWRAIAIPVRERSLGVSALLCADWERRSKEGPAQYHAAAPHASTTCANAFCEPYMSFTGEIRPPPPTRVTGSMCGHASLRENSLCGKAMSRTVFRLGSGYNFSQLFFLALKLTYRPNHGHQQPVPSPYSSMCDASIKNASTPQPPPGQVDLELG